MLYILRAQYYRRSNVFLSDTKKKIIREKTLRTKYRFTIVLIVSTSHFINASMSALIFLRSASISHTERSTSSHFESVLSNLRNQQIRPKEDVRSEKKSFNINYSFSMSMCSFFISSSKNCLASSKCLSSTLTSSSVNFRRRSNKT